MGKDSQSVNPSEGPGHIETPLFIREHPERESQKTILLVEDNIVNQRIAILLLDKLGLKVEVANNGIEAVQAVASRDYPVVLMDCHMPEMDGFEATRAIRRMEMSSGKHTPIIAVTALAMVGDRERCIEAGMDDYIPKPIDKERLRTKLNQWMHKEFSFHNQKLAAKFFESAAPLLTRNVEPIDLSELEVFYGSSEEVEEVLRLFVSTTERFLPELEHAIDEHNSTRAGRMTHELKGSSASVGAKEMSLLCLQLEQEVGQLAWDNARRTAANLQQCFTSLRQFVKHTFVDATTASKPTSTLQS